jgi:hypothetical protein
MAKDKSRGKDKGMKKKKKAQGDKKKPEARTFAGLHDFSRKAPGATPAPPPPSFPPAP